MTWIVISTIIVLLSIIISVNIVCPRETKPIIYCYDCKHCQHRCSQVLEYGQVYCEKKKVIKNEFDTCGNAERGDEE
ncbi:MAG: hypothetical protein IKR26_04460 [Lachnospiraceae bacterium]|nr:hypothetical protein [Lachnospiraceae bacterium]